VGTGVVQVEKLDALNEAIAAARAALSDVIPPPSEPEPERETAHRVTRESGSLGGAPGAIDLVEQVSPGPYLELFARRQRLGWDTWGNEALEHVTLGEAGAVDE
jgi:hypothetical protein